MIAALTAWSGEPVSLPGLGAAPARDAAPSSDVDLLPSPSSAAPYKPRAVSDSKARSRASAKASSQMQSDAAPVVTAVGRSPRKGSARGQVVQTNFQGELTPVPDTGSGQVVRPFRKIADIIPYDNYEPDRELAAKDPCGNLCPRPKGGDCPDCAKDGDGNAIPCPECPWEQDLRRIGRAPGEPDREFVPRNFAHIHYCWEPTNLYHNPVYFEDIGLERYGHTRHYLVQPVVSVPRFCMQFLLLPYQMSIAPVWDKQYSLGYYRPGEYVPYRYHQIPFNLKAAAVEAGFVTGGVFLFAPGIGP
ncbi:MAG: hypothetical protein JSS02_00530 [Planctomycetes bacterium]|nr:hypothetical protein [Planctomycetota bacterium]